MQQKTKVLSTIVSIFVSTMVVVSAVMAASTIGTDITTTGTLTVTGATALSSTLGVTGATTLAGALTANGSITLGDATADTTIIKSRVATGTAAGSELSLGATYAYGEGLEMKYGVDSWAGILGSFKGYYFRTEGNVESASYGLRGMEVYTALDIDTGTAGIQSLTGLYSELLVKAPATSYTIAGYPNAFESTFDYEAATAGTTTVTNGVAAIIAKIQTATGLASYTNLDGIRIIGRDADAVRVMGDALAIENDAVGSHATWTNAIAISAGAATGINITGAMTAADISLHHGATIANTDANILTITEATVVTSAALTVGNALSVTTGGASITGGIDNNSGGITEAGAISGVTAIEAATTLSIGPATATNIAIGRTGQTVTFPGNLTVTGTFSPAITSLAGDLDIAGGDLQATTGALNIGKTATATTIKGTLNVDEAVTFDTTLGLTRSLSSQITENTGATLSLTTDSSYLTGDNMTYSGGSGSSALKLTGAYSGTTGGYSNIFSSITSSGAQTLAGGGVVGMKSVVTNTAALTDGNIFGGLFIAKHDSATNDAANEAPFIGVEGSVVDNAAGNIGTAIGVSAAYHIDAATAAFTAGAVYRGLQVTLDNSSSNSPSEQTGIAIWNMTGTQDNGIKLIKSASGFTNDIVLQNGATIVNGDANTLTVTEGTVVMTTARTVAGSGENHGLEVNFTGTLGSASNSVAGNFANTTAGTAGSWASGIYAKVTQGATKNVNGYISGAEFEVINAAASVSDWFPLVLNANNNGANNGSHEAYIALRDYGTNEIQNLFWFGEDAEHTIGTNSSTSLISTTPDHTATHTLKIMVGTTPYWILLSSAQ